MREDECILGSEDECVLGSEDKCAWVKEEVQTFNALAEAVAVHLCARELLAFICIGLPSLFVSK